MPARIRAVLEQKIGRIYCFGQKHPILGDGAAGLPAPGAATHEPGTLPTESAYGCHDP